MKFPTAFLLTVVAAAAAEPTRLPVTRDLWISAVGSEREGNNGAAPRLKAKGIQEMFLVDADFARLRGQRVVRAEFFIHTASPEPLRRVTFSTIAQEWIEGQGTGYARVPGASSFAWRKTGEERWGNDAADITSVVLGRGGSAWNFGDAAPPDADGWQRVPIAPEIAQAAVDGRSHGFFVMDDVGSEWSRDGEKFTWRLFPNRFFHSREQNNSVAPYFKIWTDGDASPAAAAPLEKSVQISPAKLPPAPPVPAVVAPVGWRDTFGFPLASPDIALAGNETVGFQIHAPGPISAPQIPGLKTRLYEMRRVGEHFDPLVPAETVQSGAAYLEIHAPHGTAPGLREIAIGGQKLSVTVLPFDLPDALSFLPEMNAYSLPKNELAFYRLAQEHRAVLNCLRYSWRGTVSDGCAPVRKADGSWDWTAWDARFGPLLDGSAFAGSPRGAVPIESFYLPLNENWPMDHERAYRGGYWIEDAFPPEYWREFSAAAAAFARHIRERGWTRTAFHFYLNNKVYFKEPGWSRSSATWIYDEPTNTQDFWALRAFGLAFHRAVAPLAPNAVFRCDISRPEWQRDLLDGVSSVEVISGALRPYRDSIHQRQRRHGTMVQMYGSAQKIAATALQPAAWCLDAWSLGADGVLPWQTIGTEKSWREPDQLALFYPTPDGCVPSLRLKSFLAGQQLVEYLALYARAAGVARESLAVAVRQNLGLDAKLIKKSEADAGELSYEKLDVRALWQLRSALGLALAAHPPKPVQASLLPRPFDEKAVREIAPIRLQP